MAEHSDRPARPCGDSNIDIVAYFTLWLTNLEKFYDERDRSNKESVRAAFAAAEKLGEKTEAALKEYKVGANEWRDTVKDLIAGLRQSGAVSGNQNTRDRETRAWLIPLLFVGGVAVLNLVLNLFRLIQK